MNREKKPAGPFRKGTAYHLRISDHILDSLYGQIGITEVEKQIERLAIFKRLHSVSQLGLVNWIFPCALHTRYTHSIGVMHVAGQMAEHINQNMWNALGGENFFDNSDVQIIRLAGLLHDIGHYPMSHNIEQAYQAAKNTLDYEQEKISKHLKYYVNCPDYLEPDYVPGQAQGSSEEEFLKNYEGSRWPHHESAGQKIVVNNEDIATVVKYNFVLLRISEDNWVLNPKFTEGEDGKEYTDEDVNGIVRDLMTMIGNMIIGNYAMAAELHPWQERYSAMVQLIHSDLDADNLDYLLRDATFSGTSYGVMDMGILLNCLTVATLKWQGDFQEEKRYLVGVKQKGLGCVEQFLNNKFLAYTQMIFNKYTSILEAMLLRVMTDRISRETDVYRLKGLESLLNEDETTAAYLKFSDHYIFDKLFRLAQERGNLAPLPDAIISRLTRSCAFDLEDVDGECVCAGMDKTIREEMINHPTYRRFLKVCEQVGELEGREFKKSASSVMEKELFSFRFEEYCLTRQIPMHIFAERILDEKKYNATRADRHYYRLATGIPVLEGNEVYTYSGEIEVEACKKVFPSLCVDCSQSILHQIYGMRYVSLRRYKIEEYREPYAS